MAITDKEVAQFAKFAVDYAAKPAYNATAERKAQLLKECRLNALGLYAKSQQDVRDSGYRVTKRVRDILWRTLRDIQLRELASSTVPRKDLSNLKMVAGGETRLTKVIVDGEVMEWVGFGWVPQGAAETSDYQRYPLAVED